jgi:DNA-dependent RNA polymerase
MAAPELDEQWQGRETIATAQEYAKFDRFYFPYALSLLEGFTTIPRQLQPHGSDLARALLEFADARTVRQPQAQDGDGDNDGQRWLARHLSSCFGSLGDDDNSPCTWAFERDGLFRQIAANPFEHRAWVNASKPWQALAAVYEWVNYLEVRDGFASRLPISTEFHPLWKRRSNPHPERHLAAINAAQASGIALTGLTSKLLATHAADAGQAMSILDGAEAVGVQAERQDLLEEARRRARIHGSPRSAAKVEAHAAPSANHQADRTEQQ